MTADSNEAGRREAILRKVAKEFDNRVPNVYATLARRTVALQAFVQMEEALEHHGHLGRAEQALIALQVALETGCEYCQHVFRQEARDNGVAKDSIDRILACQAPAEPRHAALIDATRRVMHRHGALGQAELSVLEERGVGLGELLEITTIISAYTLASYANNLAATRIDPEFRLPDSSD
ncbi:carboxymuconolactone decarboxylase family protein [Halofilum ochraceum]|uniref:carboxymuconolactone decarboxylase family protein n=1 Tax=Halofilum ochraceum TaxID=1611323 RepID=UPI0008D8EAF9|nr:carboxymuconolactone decarboxylase family protein [Halofilum ochraceum]